MGGMIAFVFGVILAAGPYTFNIPTAYPKAFAHWKKEMPAKSEDWAKLLNGVGEPIRAVTVNDQPMFFATSCKPHDCGNNKAAILFSPDQSHVVGGIFIVTGDPDHETTKATFFGSPNGDELSCLDRLRSDYEQVVC